MGSAGNLALRRSTDGSGAERALHPVLGGGRVVIPVPDELPVRDAPGPWVRVAAPEPVDHPGPDEAAVVLPVRLVSVGHGVTIQLAE